MANSRKIHSLGGATVLAVQMSTPDAVQLTMKLSFIQCNFMLISIFLNMASTSKYGSWTISKLRIELGKRKAKKTGRKQELVKRWVGENTRYYQYIHTMTRLVAQEYCSVAVKKCTQGHSPPLIRSPENMFTVFQFENNTSYELFLLFFWGGHQGHVNAPNTPNEQQKAHLLQCQTFE